MKIYVAGKTGDIRTVRHVQEMVRVTGHTITHDWTKAVEKEGGNADDRHVPPERQKEYAMLDMGGVYTADLFIAVGHPELCGTLIETGMALAWNLEVWGFLWSRNPRRSVFEHLPHFRHFEDPQELTENLWARNERRIEREWPEAPVVFGDEPGGVVGGHAIIPGYPDSWGKVQGG